MDRPRAEVQTTFSQPIRAITTMLIACALVAAGAWLIHGEVLGVIQANPYLNGLIALVFLFGVVTCFWQVAILAQSVYWIEHFVRRSEGWQAAHPPRLLAPLAALLRARGEAMHISTSSSRSILESVAQRIDEARDITRYLINLLVFLGLLGTFWGLATTVPAVVETIRSLAPKDGESGLDVFGKLMGGLESQLGGMGTAFSSSLMGLAGSLVLGLLELFAGHGQNRFYRELEEWLSSITRLGFSSGEAGSGDGDGQDAVLVGVLDHMAGQMEEMQRLFAQSEQGRALVDERITQLAGAIDRLTARMEAEAGQSAAIPALLAQMVEGQAAQAEGQDQLIEALTGDNSAAQTDAESRMRLRSIDVQMLRILEEISAGRQESMADLRADLSALTGAIRHLARQQQPTGRG